MDGMYTDHDPYQEPYEPVVPPVRAVIRHRARVTWTTVIPYVVAVAAVVLASVTLAMFMLWKGPAESQLTELRQELAAVQSAQVQTAQSVSSLSARVHGIASTVNGIGGLLSSFSSTCQTDLNGPNGPAAFDFLCKPG